MNISANANSVSGSQPVPEGSANAGMASASCTGPVSATPCAASHGDARMLARITTSALGEIPAAESERGGGQHSGRRGGRGDDGKAAAPDEAVTHESDEQGDHA